MPDLILKKDTPRAALAAATPTPLAFPALAPARATPRGAPAPQSLSPSLRPHAAISGPTASFWARWGFGANGVGGAALACPGRGGRAGLAEGVRT